MKYEKIKEYNESEIKIAIADNNADELLYIVLSVALYSDDFEYAENFCVNLSAHENFAVRGNAIQGFGYIARIHGKLNAEIIKPIIKKALKDENEFVRGNAVDAKDDTKTFLKWKYNK